MRHIPSEQRRRHRVLVLREIREQRVPQRGLAVLGFEPPPGLAPLGVARDGRGIFGPEEELELAELERLKSASGFEAIPERQKLERCHRLEDRKSTRLNSSHVAIAYAVFWLKKKTK